MNTRKIFFWCAFMPQAVLLIVIMSCTYCRLFQLWPLEYNNRLLFPSAVITLIVAIILAIVLGWKKDSAGNFSLRDTICLFLAGLIQICVLFWIVEHTGGLDGSPFSFYYLYIPSIVGITFFKPVDKGNHKKTLGPGIKAAAFIGFVCLLFVILHIFRHPAIWIFSQPESWYPFSTITHDQLKTISSLCNPPTIMDANNVKIVLDICKTANPLEGWNATVYKVVRLFTFLFPLIMVLVTHYLVEKQVATTPEATSEQGKKGTNA